VDCKKNLANPSRFQKLAERAQDYLPFHATVWQSIVYGYKPNRPLDYSTVKPDLTSPAAFGLIAPSHDYLRRSEQWARKFGTNPSEASPM
jgi:hypothetical protein